MVITALLTSNTASFTEILAEKLRLWKQILNIEPIPAAKIQKKFHICKFLPSKSTIFDKNG